MANDARVVDRLPPPVRTILVGRDDPPRRATRRVALARVLLWFAADSVGVDGRLARHRAR